MFKGRQLKVGRETLTKMNIHTLMIPPMQFRFCRSGRMFPQLFPEGEAVAEGRTEVGEVEVCRALCSVEEGEEHPEAAAISPEVRLLVVARPTEAAAQVGGGVEGECPLRPEAGASEAVEGVGVTHTTK